MIPTGFELISDRSTDANSRAFTTKLLVQNDQCMTMSCSIRIQYVPAAGIHAAVITAGFQGVEDNVFGRPHVNPLAAQLDVPIVATEECIENCFHRAVCDEDDEVSFQLNTPVANRVPRSTSPFHSAMRG